MEDAPPKIFRSIRQLFNKENGQRDKCNNKSIRYRTLEKNDRFFEDVKKIFELPADPRAMPKKSIKTIRTGVLVESEVDCGNAVKSVADRQDAPFAIDRLERFQNFCKGITHGMKLSIRANGEVEPCTIGALGKGYGNIHTESLPTIVNKMRASPVHQMFEKEIFSHNPQ